MRAHLVRLVIVVLAVTEPLGWATANSCHSGDVGRSEIGSGPNDAAPAWLGNQAEWQSPADDASRRPIGVCGQLAIYPPAGYQCCWLHELSTWQSTLSHSLQTDHVRLQI